MCFTSAVFDQYKPYVPQQTTPFQWPVSAPALPEGYPSAKELRELVDSFKQAIAAAKTFDRLTNQPDCEDPEKAKLEDRVAEIERKLEAMGA